MLTEDRATQRKITYIPNCHATVAMNAGNMAAEGCKGTCTPLNNFLVLR